jgi:SPX domain protein involved in polyphosphate accumulation
MVLNRGTFNSNQDYIIKSMKFDTRNKPQAIEFTINLLKQFYDQNEQDNIRPKLRIQYQRRAYTLPNNSQITIDENINYQTPKNGKIKCICG